MYLCIYIATHLHTVYLDWLQAAIESNLWWAWKRGSSELRDTLEGRDRASVEMDLEAVVERIWRYTWRPWSSELRDALRDPDRASVLMHLEAMNMRTWTPWSSEFGRVLRGSRWMARRVLRLFSSVSELPTVGMWQGDFTFQLSWRAGWCQSIV